MRHRILQQNVKCVIILQPSCKTLFATVSAARLKPNTCVEIFQRSGMWWEKGQNRVLTDCSFSVRRRRRRTFGHFCVDLYSLKGAKCERRRRQPKLRIVCTKAAYDVIFSNFKEWGNCAAGSTFSGTYSASLYILGILREMTLDCCTSIKLFKTAMFTMSYPHRALFLARHEHRLVAIDGRLCDGEIKQLLLLRQEVFALRFRLCRHIEV